MKRVFLAVAIVAAMGVFTSCKDGNKVTCWEVKQKITGISVAYVWGTKAEAEKEYPSAGFNLKDSKKAETDCKGGLLDF